MAASVIDIELAERVGFEPTVPVRVRRFSRPFRYDRFGISPFELINYNIIRRVCQDVNFAIYAFPLSAVVCKFFSTRFSPRRRIFVYSRQIVNIIRAAAEISVSQCAPRISLEIPIARV